MPAGATRVQARVIAAFDEVARRLPGIASTFTRRMLARPESPVDAAAVAKEAAGRLALAGRRPDDRRGAFLDAAAGAAAAHVRAHPARTDGVDDDVARRELRRPD